MASYGFGSRVRLRDHFNGSLDAGIPLISTPTTNVHDVRFTFRMWAEF
jgi:hemolysin activation/secretion protein